MPFDLNSHESAKPLKETYFSSGQELILAAGETRRIEAGLHVYDLVDLHDDSVLEIPDTTTISTDTLKTGERVKIVSVDPNADTHDFFQIIARDASGVKSLEIIVDGEKGHGYPTGSAAPGKKGRNARDPALFKSRGHGGSNGTGGAHGKNGSQGEDAYDVSLFLPNVQAGAHIKISANGGAGGHGQKGGTGGPGGDHSRLFNGGNGGAGGHGGAGGDGGDAGNILVQLIVDRKTYNDRSASEAFLGRIIAEFSSIPGTGGARGSGGDAGPQGAASSTGHTFRGRRGVDGSKGHNGASAKYNARIEVMSQENYINYLLTQKKALFG